MKPCRVVLLLITFSLSACGSAGRSTETVDATDPDSSITDEPPVAVPMATEEAQVINGLGYRPDAFFENQVDLYLPTSGEQVLHPAVLLLHGGGEDKHDMEGLALQLVEAGYAVAAANFRSMGGGEYPGTVDDAFCALAWMTGVAGEYELNTDEFYAVGFSMGGTLAAMLGVVDDPELYLADCPNDLPNGFRLQGVVVFTGIFEYASAAHTNQAMQDYVEGYLGVAIDESPEVWVQASAINWVEGSEPPFLLLHGEEDENISPLQSYLFAARLEDAGVEVEKIIVPGVEHFGLIADPSALEAMFDFLAD